MISKKEQIQNTNQKENQNRTPYIPASVCIVCLAILLLASPVMAVGEIAPNVTINQIGDHAVGEIFEISGTCRDMDPSLAIMIHPTKNYTEIRDWVLEAKDPQFSFGIECEGTEDGSPGNITRFFPNGTMESRIVPLPINRLYPQAVIIPGSDGCSWKTTMNGTNFLGDPLKPESYSVTVLATGKGDDPFYGAADTTFNLT